MILVVEVVGTTPTTPGSIAFPAISIVDAQPFIMSDTDGAVLLDGTAIETNTIQIVVNNILGPRRNNSQTVTGIPVLDREITVGLNCPYDSTGVTVYNNLITTDEYIPGQITFTNGSLSIDFNFVHLEAFPLTDPGAFGKGEVYTAFNFQAFEDGGTKPVVITNVSA